MVVVGFDKKVLLDNLTQGEYKRGMFIKTDKSRRYNCNQRRLYRPLMTSFQSNNNSYHRGKCSRN